MSPDTIHPLLHRGEVYTGSIAPNTHILQCVGSSMRRRHFTVYTTLPSNSHCESTNELGESVYVLQSFTKLVKGYTDAPR